MSKLHTETSTGIVWDSIADYLEENPEAVQFWAPLQSGHLLRKGHDIQATVKRRNGEDSIHVERTCC